MRSLLPAFLLFLITGCQRPDYVTRAELRNLLAAPGVDTDLALSPQADMVMARLAAASFVAPPAGAASSAPAASATADKYTSQLADAIRAVDQSLNVCAHNIANAETTAFKSTRAITAADGSAQYRLNMEQGSLENTNRPLDLGISGNGFFRVKIADSIGDGFGYTRNGNFFVNNEGQLVLGMGDGYKLEPLIAIPQGVTEISIGQSGSVEVLVPGQAAKQLIGQVQLVLFVNPEGLNRHGGGVYLPTGSSGGPTSANPGEQGAGVVLQGFLESSNVDLAREYVRVRFLSNWRSMILRAIDAR